MKQVLWFLSACFVLLGDHPVDTVHLMGSGQTCSPPSFLPPPLEYKPPEQLPLAQTTHLVAGLCPKTGDLFIDGVDADKGELTFSIWAPGDTAANSLLETAESSGLPFILYTSPVKPNVPAGSGGDGDPVDPCELFPPTDPEPGDEDPRHTQQGTNPPTNGNSPHGRFALVAVCAAQGLEQ